MMKKLSLEMLRLSTNEILGRSQMKMVTGGIGSGSNCEIRCTPGLPRGTSVNDCSFNTMNFNCPQDEYPNASCTCSSGGMG
ncbi:hypothetical protein [Algoriphagus ornithinivorans]|nr:hypothetical protein [Algoriphagus ornithinivorans]